MSYVRKIPVVCTTGGLKDFTITQYRAELSSVKVVTLTLGHPVGLTWHDGKFSFNDFGDDPGPLKEFLPGQS